MSGPALLRVGRFALRLAIIYALLYAAWLPAQGEYIRFLAHSARRVLAIVEDPPVITGLTPAGNTITLESYLSGRRAPMARWNAENIHIFVVASLAVVLAVPAGGWRRTARRLSGSVLVIFAFTLALTVVQLRTVEEQFTTGYRGFTVHTASQRIILDWANRGLIMVGMLLLPAFLLVSSYVSTWARTDSDARSSGLPAGRRVGKTPRPLGAWNALALIATAGAAILALLLTPSREATFEEIRAGLERIVALNPLAAEAHFALGLFLEEGNRPAEALVSYQRALMLNPDLIAAWFNQGNVHLIRGHNPEAIRCYQEVLRRDDRHVSARHNLGEALFKQALYEQAEEAYRMALEVDEGRAPTHKHLGDALLHLQRRCEALVHLRRSAQLDAGFSMDRRLQGRIAELSEECGECRNLEPAAISSKR